MRAFYLCLGLGSCGLLLPACGGDAPTSRGDEPASHAEAQAREPAQPPAAALERIEIQTPTFTFNARAAGPEDGELVLLLHGFPESSYQWRHQIKALAEAGYRAVAPDQRGYCPTARPSSVDDYKVLTLANDVLDIAKALGVERFHVVGHDWGGGVAWALARLSPDHILSLTAVSTPHPDAFNAGLRDKSSCQYQASAYFDLFTSAQATDAFLANDRAMLKAFLDCVPPDGMSEILSLVGNREGMDAALNWYRANIKDRVFDTPKLGAIEVPTLYVWSDGDTVFCRETAELSAKSVTGPYRFEVIEGVGHFISDCAPDRLNALLLEHLKAH